MSGLRSTIRVAVLSLAFLLSIAPLGAEDNLVPRLDPPTAERWTIPPANHSGDCTAGHTVMNGCCSTGDCCNTCDSCFGDSCLAKLIQPSDPCFPGFISPMTNPVFFEDPRTLTEARFIFLHHNVPGQAGGGQINVMAVQLRAALTERLSFIATKDGFITSSNPLIDDGWADLSLGLKYNLIRDTCNQRLLSAGFWYELPVGSDRALQAQGDGDFHLFVSGAAELNENWNWMSGSGFRLPVNRSQGSSMWYWSNHIDRKLGHCFYAVGELNWYHWMGSGNNGIPGVEGGDLFNFGSTSVSGNDIVTGALGLKYKPSNSLELGIAWELPFTERRDVLRDRLTVDCIFRY